MMEVTIAYPNMNRENEDGQTAIRPLQSAETTTVRKKNLAVIVAIGLDSAIGINGDMVWHIAADLKRFKRLTMGHTVIMGRKTWLSLPKGALPGRRNIVVTRDADFHPSGAETASSPEKAIEMAGDDPMPFIIGGATIYEQTLPYATHLFLTLIESRCAEADTRFPEIEPDQWALSAEEEGGTTASGLSYRFLNLIRK